jgi:hypothetical protein
MGYYAQNMKKPPMIIIDAPMPKPGEIALATGISKARYARIVKFVKETLGC